MDKNILLGVSIANDTKEEILKYILTSLEKTGDPYYITTPNPEILMYASKHPAFKTILNSARLGLPDGIGVTMAGKILGIPFVERITGIDFMEYLCKGVAVVNSQHAEKPITVGFLGGRSGIAERTAECLQTRYPGLRVVFAASAWPESESNVASFNAKFKMQNSKLQCKNKKLGDQQLYAQRYTLNADIDVLFVAYGFPKQEEFMASHVGKIPVKVMMGVGGSFDYISGAVARAPLLIRSIGFEWLHRLLMQPWRIKRQLAILEFIKLIIKEKLITRSKESPWKLKS